MGREAQDIFDALSRTLPTRWDGTSIIVLDAVVIASPYRPDDCRGGAGAPTGTLARVKKVVSPEFNMPSGRDLEKHSRLT